MFKLFCIDFYAKKWIKKSHWKVQWVEKICCAIPNILTVEMKLRRCHDMYSIKIHLYLSLITIRNKNHESNNRCTKINLNISNYYFNFIIIFLFEDIKKFLDARNVFCQFLIFKDTTHVQFLSFLWCDIQGWFIR